MRLHFHPLSGCSRRVLTFLAVHDIPFEPTVVALERGEHKQPGYLALNPAGRVPAWEDETVGVLTESLAILRYLAERHAPEALGEGPAERARVDQWSAWALAHPSALAGRLNAETGLKRMTGQPVDADAAAAAASALNQELERAADVLSARPFLAAERPTLADYVLGPNLESTIALAGWTPEQPALRAWLERLQAQPNWPIIER
ncbi:MAG: glutathione S-transferase family protein [Myxococcota bacterium]|nr:glutathione S-transferase family protein [Myxococcota bacterium]